MCITARHNLTPDSYREGENEHSGHNKVHNASLRSAIPIAIATLRSLV